MVSEFKVNEIKNWLDRKIEGVETLMEKYADEDTTYLKGNLDALEDVKKNLFNGGLYDLERK